jgi:hypothetical protein
MTSLSRNRPVYTQKNNGIEVAVWKQAHEEKSFYSISANRSYRKDGHWHTTSSFNLKDRDILMEMLKHAFDHAQARLDADREKRRMEDETEAA